MHTKALSYREKLTKKTLVINEKNYFNRLKEIILGTKKFEHIKIKEKKKLNFILKSNKRVANLRKHIKNESEIPENECEKNLHKSLRFINRLSIIVLNSVLFCKLLKHLLTY